MRHVLLASLWVAGCTPEEQLEPVDTSVTVVLSNPLELATQAPLRYAVAWTLAPEEAAEDVDPIADARVWIGADGLVPGEVFDVPLVRPPASVRRAASPPEIMELRRPNTAACYRPRVLVYEDADFSGGFAIEAFGQSGDDRVLAADFGPGICSIFDLEEALDGASLELTETYYIATDYLFTTFVPVSVQGGLSLRIDGEPLFLRMTDSPAPVASLTCLRQAIIPDAPAVFATSRVSAHVDVALDADALCGAIFPECDAVDLAALEPPIIENVTSDAVERIYGCRQAERTEVFIAQEARIECDGCSCFTRAHSEAFFADPAALPGWWPCGDPVKYCESDLPLYTLDSLCDLELEVEEEEEP